MEPQPVSAIQLQMTRKEMLYLMRALSAKYLLGVDQNVIKSELDSFPKDADPAEIVKSLTAKRILVRDKQQGQVVNPDYRSVLETLFFPEQGLFSTRDFTGEGRQVVTAAQKNKQIVFHSFPQKGVHNIRVVPTAESLFQFLANWFPLSRLPFSPARFEIPKGSYQKVQALAKSGHSDEASKLLETIDLDPDEKKAFLRSLAESRMGGTMAWMQLAEGKIEKADSIAVVSDGRTAWLISQEKPSTPDEAIFTIRRTGADLSMTIRTFVERLAGMKLPRKQTDPSGKFQRFILDSYEVALALNTINCSDFAARMYVETSKDANLEFFAERMKHAQQSLADSGLCTLSQKGVPVLTEDLAQAIFTLAHADWQIQITASGGGPIADTGIYVTRGQFFSAYYSHGEHLQVVEYGKHEDAGIYIESLFPDFCIKKPDLKFTSVLSLTAMDKLKKMEGNRLEAEKTLLADGMANPTARALAEDFSDSVFRATLVRNNPPEVKKDDEQPDQTKGKKPAEQQILILLLKSPRNSWLIQFQDLGTKGRAMLAGRESFRKALIDLLV
jgi:hypothetical protein